MTPNQIVFLVLAALALFGAVGVVAFGDKPVWSALSLVLNFLVLAFVYFTLNAQFLGITQIMVYAGAIMVLFLFVIMILKLSSRDLAKEQKRPIANTLSVVMGFALALVVFAVVLSPLQALSDSLLTRSFLAEYGKPQAIGMVMYSQYVWPFLISSILLLIGVVGSILLAKRRL